MKHRVTTKAGVNKFRRCGILFTPKPRTFKEGELKKEQLDKLKAEPMLVVVDIDGEAEEKAFDKLDTEVEGKKTPELSQRRTAGRPPRRGGTSKR